MRNLRRMIASFAMIAVLSSLVVSTTAFAGTFADVPADSYYAEHVANLADEGVIDGTKTYFYPASNLLREEAAKLVVLGPDPDLSSAIPDEGHFVDVPKTRWSFADIETAYANGVINGYTTPAGYFGPADLVTREQFAKMIVEAFDLEECVPDEATFNDVPTSSWSYTYVETAVCNGITTGYQVDGTFRPGNNITRAEGATMISRALDMGSVGPVVEGDVTISLGDTPDGATVPKGATRVAYTTMDVSGTGTLSSLTFERFGAGSPSDFANVYLYEGDVRLTTGRSVNSSTHKVTFTGLNYTVDGTSELTVVADMATAATASNVNGFRLTDVAAPTTTAVAFSGVEGNLFTISGASVGSIKVERTGTLTNPKVGESDAKVAEFKLTAGSSEVVTVYGVTLYQGGSISRSNLTNFVLKQGGNEVATAESVNDKDGIVLVFDTAYMMDKGATRTFELYADVGSSARSGDTIKIYVDNDSDLDAIGDQYGFGVQVQRTGFYDSSVASQTTVEGGQVTISFQGPSIQDYASNSQDKEFMRFNVVAQNNVEIRNTRVRIQSNDDADNNDVTGLVTNATTANYTDIKLIDVETKEVLAGPFDVLTDTTTTAANDNDQAKVLTDVWQLNAGEARTLAWTADIANFVPAGDTTKFTLQAFQANDVKNLENNLYVATTEIVPSGNIVGNDHRIKAGSTSMTKAGTPAAKTYIIGSSNLDMLGLVINAGEGKDVYVKSVKFTATADDDCATETDCVLTVKLYDGTTQLGVTKSLATDSTVVFNNLNVKVDKGSSKTLMLKADLNTITIGADPKPLMHFDVANLTDLTAQDIDGNSITVSGAIVTGPSHTISDKGSLTAKALTNEQGVTDARFILAGKAGETLAKYEFTAKNEDLKLSKVRVNIPAGAIEEVNSIYLYDGATLLGGPITPDGTGAAKFSSFLTDFVVPKDGTKVLTVKGDLNPISSGIDSGTYFKATLADADFEARSAGGSNTVLGSGDVVLDLDGSELTFRKSKITLDKVATSGTLINNTDNDIYKFTVAADAAGNVSLKQLKFKIVFTDNGVSQALALGNFKFYRNGSPITNTDVSISLDSDGTTLENASVDDTTATRYVNVTFGCTGTAAVPACLTADETLAAGSTTTYTLSANATGFTAAAEDDSVTVSLVEDTARQTALYYYIDDSDATANESNIVLADIASNNLVANIIWSDLSAVPHSSLTNDAGAVPTSSGDWINGYLVKNMPIGSSTMNN